MLTNTWQQPSIKNKTERTRVYGNKCKSRKTRVTVHVFCMSSHGVNVCIKFHENMSSGFKVMEKTQKL